MLLCYMLIHSLLHRMFLLKMEVLENVRALIWWNVGVLHLLSVMLVGIISRGEGDEKHNPSSIITDVKIQPAGDKESNQNNKINLSKEMNQFHCASSYL